jgi:hypothetical protein
VELAVWTHYVARDIKPELLEGIPSSHQASPARYLSLTDVWIHKKFRSQIRIRLVKGSGTGSRRMKKTLLNERCRYYVQYGKTNVADPDPTSEKTRSG